jgi:hypothetical protein
MTRLIPIGLACLLGCTAGYTAAAESMGRLFFEPSQRAQLDLARAQRDRRSPVVVPDTEQPAPSQGPGVVTYNGVVRRSDGKSTVWINGKPITERTHDSDVSVLSVRRDGAVSVAVPQTDRSASLRVGQSMEVESGKIEESYARRATLYRPPAKQQAPTPTTSAPAPVPAAVAAPTAAVKRTAQRDGKESDPDSGAAPPVERGAIK